MKMIGIIQILDGLLMLYPTTRPIGAFLLLPAVLHIFLLHAFMDYRRDENFETGLFLSLILLVIFYYKLGLKDLLILHPAGMY